MATVSQTLDTVERRSRVVDYPFIVALAVFLAVCVYLFFQDLDATGGVFTYALDDAYIGFRIARQFAYSGIWGVSSGEWVNCTTTPLFVFVLAVFFRIFHTNIWVPLALNLIAGAGCLYVADRLLANAGCGRRVRAYALVAFCLVVPLPLLVFSGMEHVFQILLALLFLNPALSVLDRSTDRKAFWQALAVTPFMVACRYEGLFIAGVVVGLLFLRRRFGDGLLLAISAGLPVLVLGIAGVAMGGYFLPNSLLLKGSFPKWSSFGQIADSLGGRAITILTYNPYVSVPMAIAACLSLFGEREHGRFTKSQLLALIAAVVALIHVQFAQIGWLFRYEAYLIALLVLGIVASANETLEFLSRRGMRAIPALVCGLLVVAMFAHAGGLLGRASTGLHALGQAARDVYQQQRQMANFLGRYYYSAQVAANDVGAITFFTDIRVTDLTGLTDPDIVRLKLARHYTTDDIAALSSKRGVRIALVYDPWFNEHTWRHHDEGGAIGGPSLPSQWVKAGEWYFPDAVYEGGHTVSFYGVNSNEADQLRTHLSEYRQMLPSPVVTRIKR